jgi:hypothetical protein
MLTQLARQQDSVGLLYAPLVDASGTSPSGTASAVACHYLYHAAQSLPTRSDALRRFWPFEPDSLDWSQDRGQRAAHCWLTVGQFYKPSIEQALLGISLNSSVDAFYKAFLSRVRTYDIFLDVDVDLFSSTSERLELDLINALEPVPETRAIYVSQFLEEIQFLVLVDMQYYDLDLMDNLIDIETSVRAKYPSVIMSFSYQPVHGDPYTPALGEGSRLVWEKVSLDNTVVT